MKDITQQKFVKKSKAVLLWAQISTLEQQTIGLSTRLNYQLEYILVLRWEQDQNSVRYLNSGGSVERETTNIDGKQVKLGVTVVDQFSLRKNTDQMCYNNTLTSAK